MGSGGGGGALGKKTAASVHVLAVLAKSRGQSGPVCALALGLAQAWSRLAQSFALLDCSRRWQKRTSSIRTKRCRADEPASLRRSRAEFILLGAPIS